jgi:hypothetical protein
MCNNDINVRNMPSYSDTTVQHIQHSVSSENSKFGSTTEKSMQCKYVKYMGLFHFKTYLSIR